VRADLGAEPDFAAIIEPVARELLGEPNRSLSTQVCLRFGSRGSLAIQIGGANKGTWFDHEREIGGGTLDLIADKASLAAEPGAALGWLREHGYLPQHSSAKPRIVKTYDYHDEHGVLAFQVTRMEPKDFRQRRPDGKGGWIWKMDGVERVPYRLPDLLRAPKDAIRYVVEGEKDADMLAACELVSTTSPGGASKNPDKPKWSSRYNRYFRGVDCAILPDNDEAGEAHALAVAKSLHGTANSVRIVRLPHLPPKGDVSDWLANGGSTEELERLTRKTPLWEPPPAPGPSPSDRTTIKIIRGEYVAAAERIEIIATAAQLPIYSHGETLCRPVIEQRKRYDREQVSVAVLRNYNTASLRRAINPAVAFSKYNATARAFVACEPPAEIINMVLAGAQKQVFPPIRGTIATPILRPDHTIVTTPGYDAETGYYLVDPPDMPPIPAAPTRADAEKALAVIADLISEFPFVDDISRSVAYSGLITPLVRAACDVVPGHLFTAPKQGSGKSLLVDVASAIATGERAYAILAHRQPEEQDKQLTGALLEARQIIALDNLSGEIESAVLAQALEREHISLRPLGSSQTVAVLNSFNCYFTGNNVSVGGDNTRRILVGRVDPQIENPLDRKFEKPNPVDRVFAARGEFVAACLVIVLAYLAEERLNCLPPTPSYAAWSKLVREPLVWLGLPDPTDSMRTAFDDDPTNATLATLMAAWPTGQTDWTCAELIEAAQEMNPIGPRYPGLAEALKPIGRDRRGTFDVVILGNYLRSNRDKIVGGRKIARLPTMAHGGAARWLLA
jgi:putative DNA primase/helicase